MTPEELAALDDTALGAELARVHTRGAELSAQEKLTAEEAAELESLAAQRSAVTTEQTTRTERAASLQVAREAFATAPEPTPDPETEPAPSTDPEPGAVTAAATPAPVVPSVAQLAPQAAPQTPPAPERRGSFTMQLTPDGAGAIGKRYGDETNLSEITRAVVKSFQTYGHGGGGTGAKRAIAQLTRERAEGFELVKSEAADYATVQKMIAESRLEGGSLLSAWQAGFKQTQSLTAAAGWCAPSEQLYDLCALWSMDGMLDLPTAQARRGGFSYFSNTPTYAELQASTSFTVLTEAQVIAGTEKDCAEIPCPTPTEMRLDVAVTCITGSFLQAAGFPELVETWVDGLLTNHAHKLNQTIISRLVTRAGAATVIPAQGVITGTGATGLAADSSAVASVLSAVDLAATDLRYRDRMARNATFEVVLPLWVLTQFRADVIRKNGWDPQNAALADAQLVAWFSARNIRPQFVYDWQDFYAGGAGGGRPGDPAVPLTALPTTVNFLIYPAGAAVLARQDVVTLSNVYDSTNLTQNLFTRLFSEEGFGLLFPCGQIRQYTAQTCPSGATAAQVYTSCAAPVA